MLWSLGARKNGSADCWSFSIVVVANMLKTEAIVPPLAPPTMIGGYGRNVDRNVNCTNDNIHVFVWQLPRIE